jgi:thiamine-phosphate pyrophosphorylase
VRAPRFLPSPPLLVITDRRQAARPLDEVVAASLAGGARWISLREKDLAAPDRLALLCRLLELANSAGAALAVHDDVESAAALSLAGVHLPAGSDPASARRRLGERALIGISTHNFAEAREAASRGADYVTLSPIFVTASKPGYGPALGIEALRTCCAGLACPVVALGGIAPENAAACLAAGAACVAAMGSVMRAADPADATGRYISAIAPI